MYEYLNKMNQYILVADEEGEEALELPTEFDGTILLSTLAAQFPGVCGLKYRNPETRAFRGVRLVEDKLHPPDGVWGTHIYVSVYPKENKRKGEDGLEKPFTKAKRIELRCTDLIVLGLPWKSTEDDLKMYFSQFGELLVTQVKRDMASGRSKGFGFIRFKEYDAQVKCLTQRHVIDGRTCEVRIPSSKEGTAQAPSRKVFVGRLTEEITADDLRAFFSNYGSVLDVFIPRPFRAFAFVTFSDPEVARSMCGEDFVIKGVSVNVSSATQKTESAKKGGAYGGPGFGSRQGGGGGGGQMDPYNSTALSQIMMAAAQVALAQNPMGMVGSGQWKGGTPGTAAIQQSMQQAMQHQQQGMDMTDPNATRWDQFPKQAQGGWS